MFHWGLAANWPQTGPSLPAAHQMLIIIPMIAYISDDFMKIIKAIKRKKTALLLDEEEFNVDKFVSDSFAAIKGGPRSSAFLDKQSANARMARGLK